MKTAWILSRAMVLCALLGCMSPEKAEDVARLNAFMARWDDVREKKAVQRMSFARNDMPTAIVQNLGWKEQPVTVEFVRQDNGKVAYQAATTLARNETKYIGPREPLAAGTYLMKVTAGNAALVTQNFSVYGY